MLELSVSAKSDVGCLRTNNEDMLLVSTQAVRDAALNTKVYITERDKYVLAVADGLGGHEEGEVASEMVIRSLSEWVQALPGGLDVPLLKTRLDEWLLQIHEKVNAGNCAEGKPQESVISNKGTTLVGILLYEGHVFWLNCGDSRLYRFRGGVLMQVSTDHSLRKLTGDEKDANVIVNCIGAGSATCYIDFIEMTHYVLNGDCFLLCSDGFSDMCDDNQIETLLNEDAKANRLVDVARANGGRDNISVIVVKIKK